MNKTITPENILKLGLGLWGSKTLLTAVELGVFTELAKGGATVEQLQTRFALNPRGARDFFDALVALGLLNRTEGVYQNTEEAETFLDKGKPTYVGGILEMSNHRLYPFWGSLTEALRTGQPQNECKTGANAFDDLYRNPERMENFLAGMTGISLPAGQAIAEKFPWADYKSFADVGCAQGAVPVQVAQRNSHLRGLGFDLAVVQPVFEKYVRANGLAERLRFEAGDFFKDALPTVDVLIMGHILHDWDLQQKKALLAKAHAALPSGGALIVYEALIDDDRRTNAFGLLMSLNMLIETPGGFDYTGADCCGWMREAGFKTMRVEHLAGPDSMVIGIK
jgi:SAM-dependent methyltransferase